MSRYIDADALSTYFDALVTHAEMEGLHNMAHIHKRCLKLIEEAPTADVVEVIRCKDCVKKDTPNCAMWYDCEKCKGQWSWCNPNDFCSYGERSENGKGTDS